MHSKPSVSARSFVHVIVGCCLTFHSFVAHASYTVIDDDLYPASVIEARSAPAVPDEFNVAFPKFQSALGQSNFAVLDSLLPHMQNASIRIVGRPDATLYAGKLATLARSRAINIRDYLVRRGIPLANITVETDNSPNPQANGSGYPSDLYVLRDVPRAPSTAGPLAAQAPSEPQRNASTLARAYAATQGATVPPAVAPVASSAAPDPIVAFINQFVQSGQMKPEVALKLLRTLMESEPHRAPQASTQLPAQVAVAPVVPQSPPPLPPPSFVATPALVRNTTWALDKNLTLRENVDAWSKLAGWNASVWDASNYYKVTTSSTIEGGFPDVLRQVADGTGLNICVKTREKYIRVTDPTVACK